MNISARLRSVMQQRGLNLTALAQRSGLAVSSISRYLSGKQEPGAAALARLASALDVSMAALTGSYTGSQLSLRQQLLVQLEQLKDVLLDEERTRVRDTSAGPSLPLYQGIPDSKSSAVSRQFLAPADVIDEGAYAVRVSDDINFPRLQPGDIAVFSPAASWKNGDFCAVALDNGTTLVGKIARRGKQLLLKNTKSPKLSRTVSLDRVKGIHKLVWIKSS